MAWYMWDDEVPILVYDSHWFKGFLFKHGSQSELYWCAFIIPNFCESFTVGNIVVTPNGLNQSMKNKKALIFFICRCNRNNFVNS